MKHILLSVISLVTSILLSSGGISQADSKKFKVLVVMSYEEDNPWCQEIREGIDQVLSKECAITYLYMNTKVAFAGGPQKAKEAFSLYQRLQPDGVIAADDDAQAMFVVPYLKGKVKTPVMFTGVNGDAETYGYPNEHISGVLERAHVKESLAFVQQLVPSVRNVCIVVKENLAGRALFKQVQSERQSYPAEVKELYAVQTIAELKALAGSLTDNCQALLVDSLEGILSESKMPLNNRQIFDELFKFYPGPVVGFNSYHVEEGALCAVVKTGQEQGELAAEQLHKALQGTRVEQIPITVNYRGKRLINVDTMTVLGITPRAHSLQGATLVRTRQPNDSR
jgi:ABC-type uncharacterized transport system substrate-binding protein